MVKEKKLFSLFWIGGSIELVEGVDIEEAFKSAGYQAGAVHALDFYREGDATDIGYVYDEDNRVWVWEEPAASTVHKARSVA